MREESVNGSPDSSLLAFEPINLIIKKMFQKIASAMTLALLFATVVSCGSKPAGEPQDPNPGNDGLTVSLHITPIFSSEVKRYPELMGVFHSLKFGDVGFSKDYVAVADTAKVKAELMAEADVFYKKAIERVNAFDFNTLFGTQFVYINSKPCICVEDKEYEVVIKIQKPVIWGKKWSTSVAECPVKEISFASIEPIVATLTLQDNSQVQSTNVRRSSLSPYAIVVSTADIIYRFKILSETEMQIYTISGEESVLSKNYIFNLKN